MDKIRICMDCKFCPHSLKFEGKMCEWYDKPFYSKSQQMLEIAKEKKKEDVESLIYRYNIDYSQYKTRCLEGVYQNGK